MMSRYVQIIPAVPGAVAHCYFVDEDSKRIHDTGKFWQAPIVCYGLTAWGGIEPIVMDEHGSVFAPYIASVDWQGNFRA